MISNSTNSSEHKTIPRQRIRYKRGLLFWSACWLSTSVCMNSVLQQTGLAQKPVARKEASSSDQKKWPKTAVYIPVDELDALLMRDRSGVLLPRTQYEALKKQAKVNSDGIVLPNSNIIIHDATYQATVSNHQLMIEATISIQQFQQKMTVVNLPLHGLAVESAMLDQQPAMIARSSGKIDLLQLFSQQQGEHQFVIKLSAPLNTVGSDQVAQFRLLPNVASRFKLEIPSNQYLIVNDLRLKPSTKNKKTGYEFPIGGTGQVNLKITEQTHEQTNDSLVFARSAIGVSVSPGKVAWQAQTALSIYGQSLDQIILSVPQSLEIVSVESTGLESWELNDSVKDQQRTEITLNYRQPIEGERQIICRGVMTTKTDQAWNVPDLHIEKVNSHVGSVLIRYPYGVRLQVENTDSVRRRIIKNSANAKKAPERSVSSPGLDFDFWQQMFDITLVTQEKRSEVQMAASTIVEINEQGMNLQLVTTVESLFAPLFEFQMHIPAEWTILGATIQNQNVNWKESSREAGSKLIRLPFVKALPSNTEAKVVILAHRDLENWPPDSGSQLLELPKIELPQAKILEGSIIINADSDWDLVPSGLTNLEPMQERISKMRFGYQYQDNNYKGSLTVSRKPLQLAARHLQYVRLDQTTFFSHFETTLNVERGSYRKLMVALPESVGTDLQFRLMKTDGKIIEQVADKPQNGLRVWTLKMDRRLSGKQILVVTIEQPRKEGEIVTIPQLQIMSADRQYGEVAFEAEGDQRLRIQTMGLRGQPLTSIDAAELQLPVTYRPRERIVAAYRFVGVGHQIQAEETRFKQTVVPTAIAHQLALKSLLGHVGEVQNEVLLSFSAVGIQSLKVALPDQALLLSALVDGIPVEVRNTGKAFIIPVASGSQSAGTRTLKLLYDVNQRPLDQTQQFSQSPPQVAVVDGAGQTQPLEILNQSWSVLYPDELLITESKGDFIPAKPLLRPGMLESIRRQLSLLSPRQMVDRLFMIFFICIAILICTYCFRRGGISGMAFLIGGFCVLFLMILLLMPALNSKRALVRISSSRNLQEQPGQAAAAYSSDDGSETDGYYLKDKMEMIPNVQDGIETEGMGRSRVSGVAERAEKALGLQRDQSQLAVPMDQPALAKSPQGVRSHTIIRNVPKSQLPEPSASIEIEGKLGGLGGGALPAAETPAAPKEQSKNDFVAGFESPLPARTLGGRLSVVAPLPEPVGFHSLAFQYYGAPRQEPLSLSISLQQSQRSRRFCLAVIAGLLWLSWLFRGISCRRKLALVIFGILFPVTCSALVSAQYQSLLDGVFWGSMLTSILWSLEWFYQRLRSEIKAFLHSADKQATVTSLILLGSFLCSPEAVFAQKKPVVEPKLPQNLVIPYEVGKDPLSSQRIFLSREEFIKLWNEAHPDQRVNQESESGGVISQALYSAKVKAGAEAGQAIVHVKGRLVIHTIGNQPATLPLPLGEAAISSALLDGKSATILVRQAKTKKTRLENVYSIVISKPGLHLLDLEFDLPARQAGVTGSFRISLQPVASGRFTLELSDKDSQISITGSRASYRKQTLSGKTTLELPIDLGGTIQFAWRPAEERGAIQGIVQCKSTQATVVQDAGLVLRNEYDYRVRQGEINQASLKISEGLRIQSIYGPDVGGWELVGTGEERRIKVFLRRDIKDTTKINIVAFHPLSVSKQSRVVNIPQIAPENITNETGTVGVYAEPQFQIRPEEIAGAIQIDVGQFKNPATSSPALKVAGQVLRPQWAYRFSRRPLIFRFSVSRRQPEKLAVAEHAVLVSPRKMSLSSRVKYQLKGTPESTFVIELPETYLILNVNAEELDDWYVIEQNADDMRVLILEFKELKTNQVEVVFDGVIPRNANKLEAEVMMPTPLEVSSVRSDLAIWCDDSLQASAPELKDWRSISPEDLSAELKEQQPRLPQFAFRSTAELPEWINLELSPARPMVTANSLVMTTVGNVSVSYTVGIRWTIQGAATDVFSFTTPAWLGEQLDFRGESIRQVDKKVIGGAVVQWTIYLQDAVEGSYFITAESTLSPPDSGKIEIPQVRVMDTRGNIDPQTTELEIQQHFLMLVNHSWARLSLLNQDSIAPVERQEMPLVINDSLANQAMELARIIRNRKPPIYQIQQFQPDQGAAAAVNLADLTTVLANDGSWKTQADYRIRNRSRQFLAIRLPEKTQVLSAFVKGRPTAPVLLKPDEQNKEIKKNLIYLIALPKASAADLSFSVKLIIAGRLAQPLSQSTLRWQAQLVDMQPPQVVIPSENADYGIPVAQTKWTVYIPNDYTATALLDDPRTNMIPIKDSRSYSSGGLDISNLAKDVDNLYSVYSGSKSSRVRSRVIKNLKRLEEGLKNTPNSNEMGQGQQGLQIKQKIGEIQLREQQRQAQQEKLFGNSRDMNGDGQVDFDSDETFNQLVIGNNAALFEANKGVTFQKNVKGKTKPSAGALSGKSRLSKEKAELRGFSFQRELDKKGAKKKATSKPVDSRALRRKQSFENAAGQIQSPFGLPQQQNAEPNASNPRFNDQVRSGKLSQKGINDLWMQLNEVEESLADAKSTNLSFGSNFSGLEREDTLNRSMDTESRGQQAGWTQAGGISLKFNLPIHGRKLEFTKINGQPKLALSLRSENTYEIGSAVLWTLIWGLISLALIWYGSGFSKSEVAQVRLGALLVLIGLTGWLFLSKALAIFAMVFFIAGSICLVYRYVKRAT